MTQVLLIGDSLIAGYDWQNRMNGCQVSNLGVPGVMTSDVYVSLDEVKALTPYADLIMVMTGTNDILTGNYDFIHTLKKICIQLMGNYPASDVLITSIFPIDLPHLPYNTIESINRHIEALTMKTGSCYLDIHSRLKNSEKPVFQEDGVHITSHAYEIWCRSLLEHIAFLIEDD
jgi:lysophospholipase L1-like esterase